ncbi:MAG: HDOD domain-containing protein [bacterium]|nr:HDOD domain-containing protein [bacterium]
MEKDRIISGLFLRKKKLPTLPIIFTEFNKLMSRPYVSTKQIAELIKKDQSMVVKILQLSNSALYAKRQKINNLTNAITYLGTETLRNIILQISLVRIFKFESGDIPDFNPAAFWEHSLATAYFTDIMVKNLRLPPDENIYIGGLLHDIGKVLIYEFYPEKFEDIILKQLEEEKEDLEAEKDVLGVDHAEIGGFLAEEWKFKKDIVNAIENHHKLLRSRVNMITAVVSICNLFAKQTGLSFPWEEKPSDISGYKGWQMLQDVAKTRIDIDQITMELAGEAENVKASVQTLLADI